MNTRSILQTGAGILIIGAIVALIFVFYTAKSGTTKKLGGISKQNQNDKNSSLPIKNDSIPKAIKPNLEKEIENNDGIHTLESKIHDKLKEKSTRKEIEKEITTIKNDSNFPSSPPVPFSFSIPFSASGPSGPSSGILPSNSFYSNIPRTKGQCSCMFKMFYMKKGVPSLPLNSLQIPSLFRAPSNLRDKLPKLIEKKIVTYVHDRVIEGKRNKCYVTWRYVLLRYRIDDDLKITVIKHEKRSKLEKKGQVEFCIE